MAAMWESTLRSRSSLNILAIFFYCVSTGVASFNGALSLSHTYLVGDETAMEPPTPPPKFLSRGHSFRTVIGDTLTLPCEVQNLGSNVLLWRRGGSVLTAANLMVTRDPRFRLADGYNLQIRNVRPTDAGDYLCQIGDQDTRDQVHTVEILVPPSVRASPATGHVTARKGGSVTLECKASGNPVPNIHWTRKDNPLPIGVHTPEGSSITLEGLDRTHGGVYQCTAQNGVGEPVTVDMQLTVLAPPEIMVEKSWVHAGEGFEAQLVCTVHGEANQEVMWYQDSFLLDPTDRRSMESRGDRHTLTIKNVQPSDFGNYSCVADNSLGRAKKYMELSGRPAPAEFHSPVYSRHRDSYNLTWTIESHPPLEEVRLLYRKLMMNDTYQHPGRWHDVILHPVSPGGDTSNHFMAYNIRGLEQSSVFEAIVQAKNRYGWNEVSDIYQFYTRGNEPIMEDMELVASSTSDAAILSRVGSAAAILGLHVMFIRLFV